MSARSIGLTKNVKQKTWEALKDEFDGIVTIQDSFSDMVKRRSKISEKMIRVTCCFELLPSRSKEPVSRTIQGRSITGVY